jgi:hypothetical protein
MCDRLHLESFVVRARVIVIAPSIFVSRLRELA